jgi:hypothetical protein
VVWVSLQILSLKLDRRLPAAGSKVATLKNILVAVGVVCIHQVLMKQFRLRPNRHLPGV